MPSSVVDRGDRGYEPARCRYGPVCHVLPTAALSLSGQLATSGARSSRTSATHPLRDNRAPCWLATSPVSTAVHTLRAAFDARPARRDSHFFSERQFTSFSSLTFEDRPA